MQHFKLTIDQCVAHLQLACPDQMNTMSPQFWRELDEVLQNLHRGNEARALVISSTGKHFTAGMSLDVFSGAVSLDDKDASSRAAIFDKLMDMQVTFNRLESLRIPVIACIQGGCIGGGVDLISACDIRIARQDAFFCIQEINIGMVADLGTLQRLPKLIPEGIVRELAYTGRRLQAPRALALGLVNDLFEDQDTLVNAGLQMAREIASKPPVAIWGSKQAIQYARDHSTEDALKQMGWLQSGIWDTQAVRESVAAFKEKRGAQFAPLNQVDRFIDSLIKPE
jgi:enoyl-CoA hydratase